MAKLGHDVVGIDVHRERVVELQASNPPFFEPDLRELIAETQAAGKLRFSAEISDAKGCLAHFVCVGTPQRDGEYAADLTYVDAAVRELLPHLTPGDLVVGKSTVPVGTASALDELIRKFSPDVGLAWNPEFLREGHAINDTLHPDRLVYGVPPTSAGTRAQAILDEVYADALAGGTPRIVVNYATAELVKTAANSFLATKISFINAMSELCDASGADVTALAHALGLDQRIGRPFLNAGIGFGGGCLPKDIRAFMARAGELGADQALTFLREVDAINMRRRSRAVDITRDILSGSLIGKRITVLGASFKPGSDDVRDSPALSIAAQLQLQGATVTVTDPKALNNAAQRFPELTFEPDTKMALVDAHAVLLLTEWDEYKTLDARETASLVEDKNVFDGRNCLDAEEWRAAGWRYKGIGRP